MADDDKVLAELDLPPSPSALSSSQSTRFHPKPKSAKATAKSPAEASSKISAKAPAKTTIKPKTEPIDPLPTPPVATNSSSLSPDSSTAANPKPDPDALSPPPPEEEEDEVVREIDVFVTPSPLDEDQTKIYVMQYPLRPHWRPYDQPPSEVRIMPKCTKMEVDLYAGTCPKTYDADMARSLGMEKQTLSSLVAPSATDYAVGVFRNNQIHLNPIHAVVQLRAVIRSDQLKRKRITQQLEGEKSAKTELVDSTQKEEDDELWIPLEYHPETSDLSHEYHDKMVSTEHKNLEFRMTQSDYLGSLCPGESISRRESKEAIIRELLKLPLGERLKKWFTEVSQLNRFDFIEYMLAPAEPEQDVLREVQILADLVRGVWVTKTSLLYEGYEAVVRDYILLHFIKRDSICCEKLRANLGRDVLGNKLLRPLLTNLIISKPKEDQVKFKGLPDPTFRKRYPGVVQEQEQAWSGREESILEMARKFSMNGVSGIKRVRVSEEDKEKKLAENGVEHGVGGPAMSVSKSIIPPETQNYLHDALAKIFDEQKVRTLRSVVRDLRELAKRLSALPKGSDKNKHLIDGALCGASATLNELLRVVNQVAVLVNDVYVMKPPKKEHLRNVFIYLFRESKQKSKKPGVLTKQEIMQCGKDIFKRVIGESEYAQVVDELCITTEDGGVMLRSGD